ncbi:phenylalanine--tRNA ligase subunit alpha [Chloroflexota bacterium]
MSNNLQLAELRTRALADLEAAEDQSALEEWRVRYLGKKSELIGAIRSLSTLHLEERRLVGALANETKGILEAHLARKKQELDLQLTRLAAGESLDVTLPGHSLPLGHLHPITQVLRQICGIFVSLGFQVVEGPEVEWDYYNFEALNIPADHPARDMWDTLWMAEQKGMLLRTHTSPMQIRLMEQVSPPLRVVMPGRVFRYEATDATHESMFYQIEGLAVDRNITMADLKGTLYEFTRRLFGEERKVRFRCDYFPFVEPGVEMAISCLICNGAGCRLCGQTGWIEILGAGIVHPSVFEKVGYDPEVYTGFAFGMGIERILMLRSGIDDIRHFYRNDLRFLQQF